MGFKFVGLCASLMWLSACVGTTSPAPAPAVDPTLSPQPEEVDTPPVQQESLPDMPAESPNSSAALSSIDYYQRKNPAEMQSLFGEPDFVRRDGAVQMMQYQEKDCVLDVIFYEETVGEGFHLSHMSGRKPDGSTQDVSSCLASVLANQRVE